MLKPNAIELELRPYQLSIVPLLAMIKLSLLCFCADSMACRGRNIKYNMFLDDDILHCAVFELGMLQSMVLSATQVLPMQPGKQQCLA